MAYLNMFQIEFLTKIDENIPCFLTLAFRTVFASLLAFCLLVTVLEQVDSLEIIYIYISLEAITIHLHKAVHNGQISGMQDNTARIVSEDWEKKYGIREEEAINLKAENIRLKEESRAKRRTTQELCDRIEKTDRLHKEAIADDYCKKLEIANNDRVQERASINTECMAAATLGFLSTIQDLQTKLQEK